jgi:hypothetical protein
MPHRVNITMNAVEAARGNAARDTGWGESRGTSLVTGHDAVLVRSDPGNDGVRPPFVAFFSHSARKATSPPISPPFIAGFRPAPGTDRAVHSPVFVL